LEKTERQCKKFKNSSVLALKFRKFTLIFRIVPRRFQTCSADECFSINRSKLQAKDKALEVETNAKEQKD
jgi:hypothetical protein